MTADAVLSLSNPLFGNFMFYATVLILKTVFMSFWTGKHRIANKALPLPEDYSDAKDAAKARQYCEPVERVRRAHLNDLENIPMFIFISLFYLFTNPTPHVALWHFRLFTGGRILHTLGMLNAINKLRGVGFMVSTMTLVSVIGQVLFYTYTAGFY